ncbi:aminotransferase class III-fold pyridoxal phosphate-dependent enzyme [Streptococcus cristatus]|uniref:Aminotransferase class III-fold pyridoxal phosphate-dependent enzyme n=1 Tax=Streptococcus cristatus TaxID=45634 RepID=A0AAW5WLN9_STRCR|nr:aminotransferase class III-fold pyridoxal phosphate-dependent enzyme [Streptococcus cristatus]MCY7221151.1 aminotransferase class III-fold pyridoxal phosphate-dependent enzyme [Streptococcus cristatus]
MQHYAFLNGDYTDKTLYNINPVCAEGSYLYNKQNRKYLDLRSGLWNTSLGYEKELYQQVSDSFAKILENKLPYIDINSFYNKSYDEVAQKLLKLTGKSFNRVIYTNSGSENTELSLKIAGYLNKKSSKNKILTFKDSYHGTFFGGVSVSGIDQEINSSFYPKYGEVTFIDYPKNLEDEKRILEELKRTTTFYDVMVIEPILASAGVYCASIEFFNKLLQILKENKVLTIFDEVATGFFKTGTSFFFQHLSEVPDLLCLSKALNNGIVPFGCVCINKELDAKLQKSDRTKEHFSTQNGNLLGIASADVVLGYYIDNKKIIEEAAESISKLIRDIFDSQGISYRNIGVMTTVRTNTGYALKLVKELENLGILVYLYTNSEEEGLSIMPQFNIDKTILKKALTMIAKKISKNQ